MTTTIPQIRHWHQQRSLGSGVQYHYVITGDGKPHKTRAPSKVGNACWGHNEDSIHIAICGNFEKEKPSWNMLETLRSILLKLCLKHELQDYSIYGHKEVAFTGHGTLCPGIALMKHVPQIRARIGEKLKGGDENGEEKKEGEEGKKDQEEQEEQKEKTTLIKSFFEGVLECLKRFGSFLLGKRPI